MATNAHLLDDAILELNNVSPDAPSSGDPVFKGVFVGVALTDEDADGITTVQRRGVFDLAVVGTDGAGSAVAAGDELFIQTDGQIDKNTAGVPFGIAGGGRDDDGELVAASGTATIRVTIRGQA